MNIKKRLVLLALTGVTLICSTDAFSMTRFAGVMMNANLTLPAFLEQYAVVCWSDLTQIKTGRFTASSTFHETLSSLDHNSLMGNYDFTHQNTLQQAIALNELVLAEKTAEDHHQHSSRVGGKTHCVDSGKDGTKRTTPSGISCQPEDVSFSVNPQPTTEQSSQSTSSPNICGSRLCFDPSPSGTAPK